MDIIDRIFILVDKNFREQKDFANAMGVHPSRASEWRKRKSTSYQKYLPKIAEVLGTNVQWLVTGEGEKNRQPAFPKESGSSEEFAKLFVKLTPENQKLIIAAMQGMQPDK